MNDSEVDLIAKKNPDEKYYFFAEKSQLQNPCVFFLENKRRHAEGMRQSFTDLASSLPGRSAEHQYR